MNKFLFFPLLIIFLCSPAAAQNQPSDIVNLSPTSAGRTLFIRYKNYLIPISAEGEVSVAQQSFDYDELGRLVRVFDSINGNRSYNYDAADNRTSVTNN